MTLVAAWPTRIFALSRLVAPKGASFRIRASASHASGPTQASPGRPGHASFSSSARSWHPCPASSSAFPGSIGTGNHPDDRPFAVAAAARAGQRLLAGEHADATNLRLAHKRPSAFRRRRRPSRSTALALLFSIPPVVNGVSAFPSSGGIGIATHSAVTDPLLACG